jgi:hypothetical protein
MSQRGIVSDWSARSKRKIGEDIHRLSHPMHSFSTSANFVRAEQSMQIFAAFVNIFLKLHPIRAPD